MRGLKNPGACSGSINSPDLLSADDRCRRLAHWSQSWERNRMRFNDILRRSVIESLIQETDDAPQYAGDTFMTYCSLRSMDVKVTDLYSVGVHGACLADLITYLLRGSGVPWERPADVKLGEQVWESSAFREASGVRLRGIVIANSFSAERLGAEKHAWQVLGEVCAYEMPMTLTVVVTGASRDARCHGPLAKGWLHPVGNKTLRFKKRDGTGLTGASWKQVFREDVDYIDRDYWIECMKADGVLSDVIYTVEVPVPIKEVVTKVRRLAEKKLERILNTKERPEPQPSVCDAPVPCQFSSTCWQFQSQPREPEYIRLK